MEKEVENLGVYVLKCGKSMVYKAERRYL